jgi:very-short-patch-repair endonuclease
MTDAERRMWSILRGDAMGVRFRRQLVIGPFIADFCAPTLRLVVEVDGGQHADNPADTRRTEWLAARGYRVLRFWNTDVLLATDDVAQVVWDAVVSLRGAPPSPPTPLPQGEGGAAAAAVPEVQPDACGHSGGCTA